MPWQYTALLAVFQKESYAATYLANNQKCITKPTTPCSLTQNPASARNQWFTYDILHDMTCTRSYVTLHRDQNISWCHEAKVVCKMCTPGEGNSNTSAVVTECDLLSQSLTPDNLLRDTCKQVLTTVHKTHLTNNWSILFNAIIITVYLQCHHTHMQIISLTLIEIQNNWQVSFDSTEHKQAVYRTLWPSQYCQT